jgi:hypothetical protein
VISAENFNPARLSRRSRFFAAIVGVGLLAALLVASQLRPEPRGWGTHEQLGLPPCAFFTLTGRRCPACGMTTAWAQLAHGQLIQALKTHATGTLLAAMALPLGLAACVVAAIGKRLSWWPDEIVVAGSAAAVAGLILLEWATRLLAS